MEQVCMVTRRCRFVRWINQDLGSAWTRHSHIKGEIGRKRARSPDPLADCLAIWAERYLPESPMVDRSLPEDAKCEMAKAVDVNFRVLPGVEDISVGVSNYRGLTAE